MRTILFVSAILLIIQLHAQWETVIGDSVSIRGLTSHGDTLIAGTTTGRIFISPDLGGTWMERSEGLPELPIKNIGVTANGSILCNIANKIWRSSDWHTWEDIYQSQWHNGLSLAIKDSLILYGAELSGGLHASLDNGDTWSVIHNGYISGAGASGDTIYIANWGSGVFRSWDHGANWQQMANMPSPVYALSDDGRFAAREQSIYRRHPTFNTWVQVLTTQALQLRDIAVSLPFVAVGGISWSIYLSQASGGNWVEVSMPADETSQLEFAGGFLYAACNGLLRLDHENWLTVGEQLDLNDFHIYPNPSNGLVCIIPSPSMGRSLDILIYDGTGRELATFMNVGPDESFVDLTGFPTGVYAIFIYDDEGERYVQKLVIE